MKQKKQLKKKVIYLNNLKITLNYYKDHTSFYINIVHQYNYINHSDMNNYLNNIEIDNIRQNNPINNFFY